MAQSKISVGFLTIFPFAIKKNLTKSISLVFGEEIATPLSSLASYQQLGELYFIAVFCG